MIQVSNLIPLQFSIVLLYQIGSFTTRILIKSCSISFSSTSTNKENYIAEIKCLVNKKLILPFGENRSFYSPALLNSYNLIINSSSNFLYTQTGETVFRRPYGPRSSWQPVAIPQPGAISFCVSIDYSLFSSIPNLGVSPARNRMKRGINYVRIFKSTTMIDYKSCSIILVVLRIGSVQLCKQV